MGFSTMKCTLCQKYLIYGVAPLWAEREKKAEHMEHMLPLAWFDSAAASGGTGLLRTDRPPEIFRLLSKTPIMTQKKMEHFCTFHHHAVH